MALETKANTDQLRLIAEFLSNIGVAWFAAGVIGVFISGIDNRIQAVYSVSWSIALSVVFLFFGLYALRGAKTK